MRPELGVQQHLQTVIFQILNAVLIQIWMPWDGIVVIQVFAIGVVMIRANMADQNAPEHIQLLKNNLMPGAFMTCTAMSMNGARTFMGITHQELFSTPPDHQAVFIECFAAAAGFLAVVTAVRQVDSGTNPASETTGWASAL